jgi:GNAT superfamily N-acetyltransferase
VGTITVRAATADDDEAVLALLQASMGWVPDSQYAAFFRWKHRENPFGPSPAWVAVDDDAGGERIVGFRTFLRWAFDHDGRVVQAVRAVDTATHPDHQGRGIFSLLTRQALEELHDDGVDFVFNTPNERSRPGYLKMGWQLVQRLPVAARPRSALALVRLARARTPADKWSATSTAGTPAVEAFADDAAVEALLDAVTAQREAGLTTRRSPAYLRWRYGFAPLHYRVLTGSGGLAEGAVVFRVRRRGAATEVALCEVLVPGDDATATRHLLHDVMHTTQADHAVRIGPPRPALGFLPVPGQGPTLVWREVRESTPPPAAAWHLTLGDIELF